jgi:hypothetical protein
MNRNALEALKSRVRKLLALSKSDNENEAAAALEKANKLIERYDLDGKALEFESISVRATKRYVRWRAVIANAVSWLYGCHHYLDGPKGVWVFTGEPLYVFMAVEMNSYLVKSAERIAGKSVRKNAKYKYRQSFKYGMADRLFDRIIELGADSAWAPYRAAKKELAQEYVKTTVRLEDIKTKKQALNAAAMRKGASLAEGVSLVRQAGYSGQAPRRIAGPPVQRELF